MEYSNDFFKVAGIVARLLRVLKASEEIDWKTKTDEEIKAFMRDPPLSGEEIEGAKYFMFLWQQDEVNDFLNNPPPSKAKSRNRRKFDEEKKTKRMNMESLAPFLHKNIWSTQGRFGSELGKVLGPERLAILPPTCRLSHIIMVTAHNQAHRGGADTCFRSRSFAWIVKARPLADKIARECKRCPLIWKSFQQQQLGLLPPERLRLQEKPWSATAIDLFGPYKVPIIPKSRTQVKVWPIVFGCLNTGALHCEVAASYGADSFLAAYTCFTSVRGAPSQVYTDKGSQLTRASANVQDSAENWDWKKVQDKTARLGTSWRFCPAGAQWRNGLAEARVRHMKEGLDHMMPAGAQSLSLSEFTTVIKKVCNTINDRPLAVKLSGSKSDGEILPITPNDLLLGRTSNQLSSLVDSDDEDKLTRRIKFIEEVEREWWKLWFSQCWHDLFPRHKWKNPEENLRTGDICLKGYSSSLGKNRYVICRVGEVFPDENGLVRTVEIFSRPHDSREKSLPYKHKELVPERIAVQRLVLISRDCDIKSV